MTTAGQAGRWQARVEADPHDETAFVRLGFAFFDDARWLESAAAFRRAVELNPALGTAWLGLGRACRRAGILKEAAAAFATGTQVARRDGLSDLADQCDAELDELPAEFRES